MWSAAANDGPRRSITSSTLRSIGISALVALIAELLALRWLVTLDDALWRAILHSRGCGWDALVELATDVATTAAIALLALASVVSLRTAGLRATWPPLAACMVGLLAGKVLKNFFARERPSMIADVALGHSFPSAHVMNTGLATLAVMLLTAPTCQPRRWSALSAAFLVTNCAGRLLVAHHWLTDVVGGLLAALAVAGLTLPAVRRRPLLAPCVALLALGAVLGIDLGMRTLEISLPSPLSTPRQALAEVTAEAALGMSARGGAWEAGSEGIRGLLSAAWLHGAGTITLEVPRRNAHGRSTGPSPEPSAASTLVVAGRPDVTVPGCGRLQVAVNGTALRAFVPFVGWREYRLRLPPGVLHAGGNAVQIAFASDTGTPRSFAVAYLRLVSR